MILIWENSKKLSLFVCLTKEHYYRWGFHAIFSRPVVCTPCAQNVSHSYCLSRFSITHIFEPGSQLHTKPHRSHLSTFYTLVNQLARYAHNFYGIYHNDAILWYTSGVHICANQSVSYTYATYTECIHSYDWHSVRSSWVDDWCFIRLSYTYSLWVK